MSNLNSSLLARIEGAIIEETGDGELAAYLTRLFGQAEKMEEALEDYAKPQRWLRAYQPTGELGLTRCVFTSAGHGFELAQEALAELKEMSDEQ